MSLQTELTARGVNARVYAMQPLGNYAEPKTTCIQYHLVVNGVFVRVDHRFASTIYEGHREGETYSGGIDGLLDWLAGIPEKQP